MASQCPKCHQFVEEDELCCAGVEFQWKCTHCQKRTRGFVIPFGRCPLCGGPLIRMEGEGKEMNVQERVLILQQAFQIEVSATHFYRRLAEAVDDPQISDFFENMSQMERQHAEELNQKYHLHLGEETFHDTGTPLPEPFFEDLCFFAETGDVKRLYNCAIDLEKKTLDFFEKKASQMSCGKELNLYLELAAEEREHIALLESERDRMA